MVLNNAAAGLVTSLFLKELDSVLKGIASAMELLLTAAASHLLLGAPAAAPVATRSAPRWNTAAAVAVVSCGVFLYASRGPGRRRLPTKWEEEEEDN